MSGHDVYLETLGLFWGGDIVMQGSLGKCMTAHKINIMCQEKQNILLNYKIYSLMLEIKTILT